MNLNRVLNIEREAKEVDFIDFDLQRKGEYTFVQKGRPDFILHEAVWLLKEWSTLGINFPNYLGVISK